MNPSLAVVILHYADPGVTGRLHRQLLASDPAWAERVFVLDNHAPHPYPDPWKRTAENLYWAGALTWCADHFRTAGYSHLWFLNNDLRFTMDAGIIETAWTRLQGLNRRLGRVGIYSPAATSNKYLPRMVRDDALQFRRVRLVDGIAPLMDLDAVAEVGGIDALDNPIGYGVDLWLSHRLDRAGFPLVVDQRVSLHHDFHGSSRGDDAFWARAHSLEDAFFLRTFGPDARELIRDLSGFSEDWAGMPPHAEGGCSC